jgi:hypothetical protein
MAKILARVLVSFHDGLLLLSPNDLVFGDSGIVKAHEKSGLVDSNKAAVSYCQSIGKEKIDIVGEGVVVEADLTKSEAAEKAAIAEAEAMAAAEAEATAIAAAAGT